MDLGTQGRFHHNQDNIQNLLGLRASAQMLHTYSCGVSESCGESLAPACNESRAPIAALNLSVGAIECGTQISCAAPISLLILQLHSMLWETGCWRNACLHLSTTKVCVHKVRMPPLCVRNQDRGGKILHVRNQVRGWQKSARLTAPLALKINKTACCVSVCLHTDRQTDRRTERQTDRQTHTHIR